MPAPTPALALANSATVTPALPRPRGRALPRLIATLAAGATALTLIATAPTPARADSGDDMLRALIALGAIGVLAHELNRDDRAPRYRRAPPPPQWRPAPREWRPAPPPP
ncbi:MAG: hypothetical protein QM656_09095, partial [Paracoccaceae bacterium]